MNFFRKILPQYKKISYSQCGEDIIIDSIFKSLKISKISYLDIGANHPKCLSNTYLFYRNGFQGVCVEPDPVLYNIIKKKRKRDICLNIGVGSKQEDTMDFYIMTARVLNTFSKEEAYRYQEYGTYKIEKIIKVPLVCVNNIIEQNFTEYPNLVTLDTEGMDFDILKSFNFERFRPEVFCIETLTYSEDKSERKINEIVDFMNSKNYFCYADTYINTIFVEKSIWKNR